MVFRDRADAAQRLAKKLRTLASELEINNPLVLAIPRGAVPMGKVIADAFHCELDVVLVRKIGAPGNPEFAIGAVSEFGDVYLSTAKELYGFSDAYIKDTVAQELQTIKNRRASYTPIRKPVPIAGRTVILIDDGIATGATMLSAVRSAKTQRARKVIVAAPVASDEAARLLGQEADATVFLDVPRDFWAISQFYEEFSQVSDQAVRDFLREDWRAA